MNMGNTWMRRRGKWIISTLTTLMGNISPMRWIFLHGPRYGTLSIILMGRVLDWVEYVTEYWRYNWRWHEEGHSHGLNAMVGMITQLVQVMRACSSPRYVGVELEYHSSISHGNDTRQIGMIYVAEIPCSRAGGSNLPWVEALWMILVSCSWWPWIEESYLHKVMILDGDSCSGGKEFIQLGQWMLELVIVCRFWSWRWSLPR